MRKDDSVYFKGRYGKQYSLQDAQANCFAETLLMPEEKLKEVLKTERELGKIADIFQVSVMAAKRRLESLGYKIV